jgi:hypothetical protein
MEAIGGATELGFALIFFMQVFPLTLSLVRVWLHSAR